MVLLLGYDFSAHRHNMGFHHGSRGYWWNIVWTIMTLLLLVKHGTSQGENIREFNVDEELPIGTIIGKVGEGRTDVNPPFLVFDGESPGQDNQQINVTIDETTGEVKVVGRLDRERKSRFNIIAVSAEGVYTKVTINLNDINDNAPEFPNSFMTDTLTEAASQDVELSLGSAVDPDLGQNSVQRFEIVSGNVDDVFEAVWKEKNGNLILELKVNGILDYEVTPFYLLLIRAYDGANPPLYGEMTLNITIIDTNDNQPIFNTSRYFARVPENVTVGTSVLQVFATDRDAGNNGKINYYIDRQKSDEKENFDINTLTGVVFVNKPLDYEKNKAYELIVVARDNGDAKLQTTAVVSVEVTNINDNAPEISVLFLTQDGTGRIAETASEGDYVARISVSDADVETETKQAAVNISLNGGDGNFGLTTRDNIVYLTIMAKPLDRELRPYYQLNITATDTGTPQLSSSKVLTLYISDTNDNAPQFSQSTYYADIQEILPPGSSVVQLTAVDRDDGNNSMVTYHLVNTPDTHSDWFQIDNRTGLVTTRARVDCETASEPRLEVVATDSGNPPMSATATVIVRIRDVNDNQPVFDQSFYNVTVSESASVGSCILTVSASDPDCGESAALRYSVDTALGFEYPVELEVRADTGQICLISRLDYERRTSYDFPVKVEDQDGLETTAMVKILILDTNDNHPTFHPVTYNHHLLEDSPINSEVVVVRATDADSGEYGRIEYSIISGNSADLFRINPDSGEIRLRSRLPSQPRHFSLTVRATDGGDLTSLEHANVSISVVDLSQNPPEFSLSLYKFSILESERSRTVVGRVEATTDTASDEIRYSIVSGDPDSFFNIDVLSGDIRTDGVLDHDRVPYVLLNIQAQSGDPPTYGQAQVNITILDVNDNSPTFAVTAIEIPVKEDTSLTSNIYVIQAEDADSGLNGKVGYFLDNPTDTFQINAQTGVIRLLKSLDHEVATRHEFSVTAYDSGSPARQKSMNVTINVQDVNDNVPVFEESAYSFEIDESLNINTKFGSVTATDADSGNNGRVIYLLQNGPHLDTFGIFPNDGFLYNKLQLDRERKDMYELDVIAIDNGIPSRSSAVKISITILDDNDNSPQFMERQYVFYIEENRPSSTPVGYVEATDRDDTDALLYSMATTNEYFDIDPTSGEVITKKRLDREDIELHTFSVQVTDSGNQPRSTTTQVKIYVLDVNDNSPKFDHNGRYIASVYENQPKGTLVIKVSAEDGDKGENQTISYYFATGVNNGDSAVFAIHPKTGQITTTEVLDHERKTSYTVRILAKDEGNPMRFTETSVEVRVEDENDYAPVFPNASVSFTVRENTAPGTIVSSVVAKDLDSGENGRVTYYIVRGNLFGTFGVNTTTGAIIVSRPVDYEEASSYLVEIRAMDNSAMYPKTSTINVNISVIDVNDNPPRFEDDPVVIALRENSPIGGHIYTFSAIDRDSGNFGRVRYEIMSQDPVGGWFNIDSQTGELTVGRDIDFEQTTQIGLTIKATDQATSEKDRLFSTVTALVLIEDVNDNAPEFHTRTMMSVMEDEPINYPVMHVIAVDADSLENGRVSYMIVGGNERGNFNLDSETGLISIAKSLDRETTEEYRLNVSARDHGYPQRVTYMLLEASIADVNDNPPMFLHSVYVVNVTENQPIGTLITSIHATDMDKGDNAELEYIIPDGIADDNFDLRLSSGDLITNTVLDREQQGSWVITAYVKDKAFPALYDTTTVIVTVQDENDNAPVFRDAEYTLRVPENSAQAVVHTVMAADADEGDNGRITYSIIDGNLDNKFSIDAISGKLSCEPLDRESVSFYNLTIRARDGNMRSPRSSFSTVLVQVLDDNDNDPLFVQSSYAASIPESASAGMSVLHVTADDRDAGTNAQITYSLNNAAEGQFKINNVTGVITTAGEFDREKQSSYSFEAFATDGGEYGPRTMQVRVEITIRDVNDNAPVFEQVPFKAEVSLTHPIQGLVTEVKATDRDEGDNGRVSYALEEGTNPYFEMEQSTGKVRTKSMLSAIAGTVQRLSIIARDHGVSPKTSQGMVSITVGSTVGASSLRFYNHTYNVYISENAASGTSVVTTTASFNDGSPGKIGYSFGSGNDDNTFDIIPSTGKITVYNPTRLDYETSPRLRLIVIAAGNGVYGYTTVWVNLRDENDNPPRFTQERYTSAVWEGNDRGTYVTQISATDDDDGDNGRVTYTIIGGNVGGAFVIDPPTTGIVKTNIILDREIHKSYKLEIEASDLGRKGYLTSTCVLKINVIDLNDNSPQFPQFPPINVHERTELGTILLAVTANDIDLNPILRYDFAPDGNPDDMFSIDTYSGNLALAKQLDYEKQTSYVLAVRASDDLHETTTELRITVEDENDNAPVFSQQSYQVTVDEMTGPHVSVVTVNATDSDGGDNARVTYSMVAVIGFYIDSVTGTIYTNHTVPFSQSQPTIHLAVTAADHGEPARSAVVAVRVQVIDVNNHAPQFTQQVYSGEVSEAATRGLLVLQVLANDNDHSPDNTKIDYTIIGGNQESKFQIGSSSGEILLTGDLDREETSSYNLQIKANDRGEPQLTSTCVVKIDVKDVNDNFPVFSKHGNYSVKINESASVGSPVVQVHAEDADFGNNGRVQYKIVSGNDENNFEIDRDNGIVSVRTTLDHENRDIHRLVVSANDSSENQPRQSAFASVTINVTDVNEFDPDFPVFMYIENVEENKPVGTYVFTANANDKDSGFYGQVRYQLINEQALFMIDAITGEVTTGAVFDFESMEKYNFKVIATDSGGRYAEIQVTVRISSTDEFKPQFVKTDYKFDIPGNAKKGYYVGKVEATDQDKGSSGMVSFSLEEPNEYFFINRTSGKIYVDKDLQAEDNPDVNSEIMDTSARKRRFVSRMSRQEFEAHHLGGLPSIGQRRKRALAEDRVTLAIVASTGFQQAKTSIEILVDRSCPGCAAPLIGANNGGFALSGTPLVLILVFAIIAIVTVVVIVVIFVRNRARRKRNLADQSQYGSSIDTFSGVQPPPIRNLPPPYDEVNYPHHLQMTTSDISDQSHSASSGRGSAEGEDEDEEIRMINATPLDTQARMPDSGIQQDDDEDAMSEHSVQNHQEYLARLGIDTSKIKTATKPGLQSSVESMHQFSDEGGGEGDGMDIQHHIYGGGKQPPVQKPPKAQVVMADTKQFHYSDTDTLDSKLGSLSSVINSEEEFSGSYNWDYLLDWGPQFQPLADVFSEIARLKDDNIKPKKAPIKTVPQAPATAQAHMHMARQGPPPIITDAPPKSVVMLNHLNNHHHPHHFSHLDNASSSSNHTLNSARTSQMTSMASLPKSPISYESTFTTPAMTPDFDPSLSPLQHRSPSFSPIVTPKGVGSTAGSTGHTTPTQQRSRRSRSSHSSSSRSNGIMLASSGSEQEFRI